MMRRLLCFSLLLWVSASRAESDIIVIAHNNNELGELTRKQVADIYLGRITSLPNGNIPLPLDYQGDSDSRARFYQAITGKNMAQINAYWARLSFTGQANPPRRLADKAAILKVVEKNQDAIGYVESIPAESTVSTVMVIK